MLLLECSDLCPVFFLIGGERRLGTSGMRNVGRGGKGQRKNSKSPISNNSAGLMIPTCSPVIGQFLETIIIVG